MITLKLEKKINADQIWFFVLICNTELINKYNSVVSVPNKIKKISF